ncbi:hypothetical protein A3A84_02760 [Candidatus Collierbacteria bacterium RIFCSPLOWO2_01_FULL_50_23]|uniref:DUF4406 domain-containing protein n=2 Tax=Candidatus Collieribacteriota TaxID=1752725 RepID=A0A1F5EVW5_9BACT|nr:MAG: hypothetical protein A2703_01245 [Candidatus Collierbacteria bacterium RIFCSPHIGHO2_01_FULL_50_25]OGD71294.1 MAG: hypothetical protein A3D09_02695 [Candidatus Collierbacteria bacterium RIFCSPHIGHO2_02_FULL_49_10]OGD74987.1 MAG: hypothetical protein A3A84_02760 [Candidatus Collierbacteria bacterium RIFCSPLOWO2_01_FULL_50_23]
MTQKENIDLSSIEARLAVSETFEDLLEIALYEIAQLPAAPVGIVCGPVTSGGMGNMEENIAHFRRWINKLQSQGGNIFDQMPYEAPMQRIKATPYYDPTRDHLLETFYGTLFRSGLIDVWYFIPGWQDSYGATWEHDLVKSLGGTIIYLDKLTE